MAATRPLLAALLLLGAALAVQVNIVCNRFAIFFDMFNVSDLKARN